MKNHPYITASLLATLLAIVVWFVVPKEYAAYTRVSDEYKETDLAVGINKITAQLRKTLNSENSGINDIEVYCKILKTEDFVRSIAHSKIPDNNSSYGQWVMDGRHFWQTNDTIELVRENIEYNMNTMQQTLAIQFTDRDAVVASKMLDVVTKRLQQIVTVTRHKTAEAALRNAFKEREEAYSKYKNASEKYSSYADSHFEASLEQELQKEKSLSEDVETAYERYQTTTESCARQIALKNRSYCSFAVIKANEVPTENTSHLPIYILSFIILSQLFVKAVKLYRQRVASDGFNISFGDLFAPWTITILIWLLIIVSIQFAGDVLYPVSSQFYYGISLWLPIFCIVSWATFTLLKSNKISSFTSDFNLNYNGILFDIFLLFSLLCTPLCVKKVMDTIMMFGSENIMYNMRMLAVEGGTDLGILAYSFTINKALIIVSFWRYPNIPKWKLAIVILLFIMDAFVDMDKGSIFFIVLSLIFVLYQRGKISLRSIILFGIILVGIFFILTQMRSETTENGVTKSEDMSIIDFLAIYVLTTPVAFGMLQPNIGAPLGSYTLTTLYLILNRFGGSFPIIEQIQQFVWVPLPTNLYTIMQPFFLDFGYLGIAFYAIIYGVFTGWAYRAFRNGSSVGCVMYTYLIYYLVLQFGQEGIIMLPVFTVRLVFCLYILTQDKFSFSFARSIRNNG